MSSHLMCLMLELSCVLEKITAQKLVLENQEALSDVENKTPEEKQKIFEKAFQNDLDYYKRLGTTRGITIIQKS